MPGYITKRSKGSYTVVVDLGRDPVTGKRRQLSRSVKGAKREAEALLVQLLHQRDVGVDAPPGKLTVADYLQKWLSEYARPNTAPKTYARYEQYVRLHLNPALGSIVLVKLRPLHIQAVYTAMQQKGLTARTALHCHRLLRNALQQAVRWQLLGRNPCDAVEPPRSARYEVPALTIDQAQAILDAAGGTRYGALVYLAITTGLRQGELLGLRWRDVDLDAGRLSVRQTCQWLSGQGFIFRQPKTHRSTRPVALSPGTVERLHQHRVSELEKRLAAGAYWQDHDLVFTDYLGKPIHPHTLWDGWRLIIRQTGIALRFHDLRHAHASLMLAQGTHAKIVQERLGHSTISTTLDIYSHVAPGLQEEAAARFDQLLGRRAVKHP